MGAGVAVTVGAGLGVAVDTGAEVGVGVTGAAVGVGSGLGVGDGVTSAAVGAGATAVGVAVGSGPAVGVGWEPHPINATSINVMQITMNADFTFALIYLVSHYSSQDLSRGYVDTCVSNMSRRSSQELLQSQFHLHAVNRSRHPTSHRDLQTTEAPVSDHQHLQHHPSSSQQQQLFLVWEQDSHLSTCPVFRLHIG